MCGPWCPTVLQVVMGAPSCTAGRETRGTFVVSAMLDSRHVCGDGCHAVHCPLAQAACTQAHRHEVGVSVPVAIAQQASQDVACMVSNCVLVPHSLNDRKPHRMVPTDHMGFQLRSRMRTTGGSAHGKHDTMALCEMAHGSWGHTLPRPAPTSSALSKLVGVVYSPACACHTLQLRHPEPGLALQGTPTSQGGSLSWTDTALCW